VGIAVVVETHSTSVDNERGIASGWNDPPLSAVGRTQAGELGERRRDDGLAAVFASDLLRARETVEVAFAGSPVPVLFDWRLRECDYGDLNGGPADVHIRDRARYVDVPYPGGESWRRAVDRVGGLLDDLTTRWDGARVLVVGHVATRWAVEHRADGVPLEVLAAREFVWQEGWEYHLPAPAGDAGADAAAVPPGGTTP
jgi:broad specificity phosphatase PhoE